jgi:hypothetical protein
MIPKKAGTGFSELIVLEQKRDPIRLNRNQDQWKTSL